ncbi:MAG: Maf family nucleotide pyrophosphatase [Weeksellaceae bacterium]|nr:Maf family nucleotide pyrophosphatase [Weeksellaceae bacterium]
MLQEKFKDYKIILGSQSPRRRELLAGLDIEFEAVSLQVDESFDPTLQAHHITDFLCKKKAAAYSFQADNEILITSDTIVWWQNQALNKPIDAKDAYRLLKLLQGSEHEVITSVAVNTLQKSVVFHDVTQVSFHPLTDEEISYYVNKYQPLDKAGAYGVQEWIGYVGVAELKGSYFNVIGLPVDKLYQTLKAF